MNLAVATSTHAPTLPLRAALPSLIVLGLDDRGKAHASRFSWIDETEVERAADLMGMTTLPVEGDVLDGLAAKLPTGKLFASGKAFVPFVAEDLFRQLVAYLPITKQSAISARRAAVKAAGEQAPTPEEGDKDKPANDYAKAKAGGKARSGKYPEHWDKVKVGNIVLASDGREDGWWTAHVREVRADGTYLLEWEAWPGFDKFIRRRDQIGLLHPDYDGK